ncbi:hypothetical protein J4E89_001464 [Alternaria sp. Ai002NY15]|nr:hypothetical protein J4E89_001464 [Alternaria sp. Ai002NY15]
MNGNGHLHGAVRSPYAEYNSPAHEHEHGHERSGSNDSTYTLKPFSNGRPKGRARGESDLGRSPARKTPAVEKYGFSPVSPIQESPAHVPPPPVSSSWLELPEALTALLIPLPYLFAALAYPSGVRPPSELPSSLSEAVAEKSPELEYATATSGFPLLHALALSSGTLLLVGVIAKVNSSLQPLDRRKEEKGTFNISNAPKRMASNILGVLLPFYASLHIGGAKTALAMLVAVAAGIGALDQKPGKHTPWDDIRRTLRTRKVTCGALLMSMSADMFTSGNVTGSLVGYLALLVSLLLVPPPLPTAGWSLMTGPKSQDSYMTQKPSRASLPKPSSPLVNSTENQLLTIASGLVLTVTTILYSLVSSATPSLISAFLIARATPGSIVHSVLIERDSRRIAYFGVLNLSFMMVQFFYGFVSGSLGLLTDSIHMLFDCAGLAVGLAAAVMSKWRPNARFPYGYGKVDTLSGFANGVFLLLVSLEIIFDAFERLWEGHELQRLNELLIVSILGFIVNIVGLVAFGHAHHGHGHDHDHGHEGHDHGHGHSHDNENMQGIFLHILADALGSVAVIISTLLTKYYGWSGWDPIASCIIAILIFLSAIPLVKSSGARLMLSMPNDLEYSIRNTLGELGTLRGVVGYAVPKFWLEDEGAAHAEAHAKEDHDCGGGHKHDDHPHDHHEHDHSHSHDHGHSHSHSHDHAHSHDHGHDHGHAHSHSHDHHDHDHDHSHAPKQRRILGVIHIIANRMADPEDVRERSHQFLKDRGMDVVIHVEKEGEGRCWCGGGSEYKVN